MDHGKVQRRVAHVRLPILDSRQPLLEQVRGGPVAAPAYPEIVSSEPPSFTLASTLASTTEKSATTPRVNVNGKSNAAEKEHLIVTRRWNTRGTRGRGDPRNEGMRRARERLELARRIEQEPMSQQEQVRDRLKSRVTRERTVILRGRGQSRFVLSNPGDSADDSPEHARRPTFFQHHPHTSPTQRRTQANGKVKMIHGPPSSTGRRNNIFQRPSPHSPRATMQQMQSGPVAQRPDDDWTRWVELRVIMFGLPINVTTRDIWRCFSKEGSILKIELYEDNRGNREGKGRVCFS